MSVSKVINTLDKNLLLLDCETLVLKGVSFPFCLSKTINASRNSYTRILILLCYTRIITKLSSLNCSYYSVDPTWFNEFIAHFVLMVMRVLGVLLCGRSVNRSGAFLVKMAGSLSRREKVPQFSTCANTKIYLFLGLRRGDTSYLSHNWAQ
jgi:hypothetical protein